MHKIEYRNFALHDHATALALWQRTEGMGLTNADSYENIKTYLERNPGLSFIAERNDTMVATIMSGHDGKRGYIQHLAVEANLRGSGIGSELIRLTLDALKNEGIVKSHILVFANNIEGKQYWLNRSWHEREDLVICSYINSDDLNA
jgi:ribosomal protein S18 acetylase RimI-like enzyme